MGRAGVELPSLRHPGGHSVFAVGLPRGDSGPATPDLGAVQHAVEGLGGQPRGGNAGGAGALPAVVSHVLSAVAFRSQPRTDDPALEIQEYTKCVSLPSAASFGDGAAAGWGGVRLSGNGRCEQPAPAAAILQRVDRGGTGAGDSGHSGIRALMSMEVLIERSPESLADLERHWDCTHTFAYVHEKSLSQALLNQIPEQLPHPYQQDH